MRHYSKAEENQCSGLHLEHVKTVELLGLYSFFFFLLTRLGAPTVEGFGKSPRRRARGPEARVEGFDPTNGVTVCGVDPTNGVAVCRTGSGIQHGVRAHQHDSRGVRKGAHEQSVRRNHALRWRILRRKSRTLKLCGMCFRSHLKNNILRIRQ